jgi:hypothetical protein
MTLPPHTAGPSRSRMTWAILGTALLTRLMVLWSVMTSRPHDWLYTRGIEMGLLAKSLLLGQGYSSPFGVSTGPTAFIAPGYPTLIAVMFWIFGTYSFASAVAIMLLQIAACVATVWLILWIARETMDDPTDRTANLAAAFWAISPPLLFIPTIFWETSLSAGSLVAMIALALRCQRQPSTRMWIAMGAASGVIGLINPALLPSLLAILGWTAWQTRKATRTATLLGFAALLLVFSPWPIRNAVRFHAFIPTRTTVGFELWMGNRPGATGYLNESIFPMYNKAELASYISMGELAYTQDKTEQAETYIREYPGIFLKMTMRRVFRFWTGTGNQTGSAVYAIHALLTTSLGLIGIVLLYRRRRHSLAILMALPLLLFPLPYYITHAEFRYRLNIDPILTILAAYAVAQLVASPDEAQPD